MIGHNNFLEHCRHCEVASQSTKTAVYAKLDLLANSQQESKYTYYPTHHF